MTEILSIEYYSPATEAAIDHATTFLLERAEWLISEQKAETLSDCYETIQDNMLDEFVVINLNLDEQLGLIEDHAEEYSLKLDSMDIDSIRSQICSHAAQIIARLAEERAIELYEEFESFIDDHDLEFSNVTNCNPFDWASHVREKRVGDRCTVYQYRDVEGVNVDIWEYELKPKCMIYLECISSSESSPFDCS